MTANDYIQKQEERTAWRQHRNQESAASDAQWLAHVAENGGRAYSDSNLVRDRLIAEGLLMPLANKPTLRIDDIGYFAALADLVDQGNAEAIDATGWTPGEVPDYIRRGWYPEELCG